HGNMRTVLVAAALVAAFVEGGLQTALAGQARAGAVPPNVIDHRPASTSSGGSSDPRKRQADDVNRRNPDGSTPLQSAVYTGDVAEVKRLLRLGANASLANKYGATPMSLAAEVANTEILKLLLEVGANVESPNADGMTALLAVSRTGNVEAAKLLLDHGA